MFEKSIPWAADDPPSPAHYSHEREPWRELRSSVAIQFSSRKMRSWSVDQLSEAARAKMISGLESRRSIVRSYSRARSALSDFVASTRIERLSVERGHVPDYSDKAIFTAVCRLAEVDCSCSACAASLRELTEAIEAVADRLAVVIHGYTEVREKRSGEILFFFEFQGKRLAFTHSELQSQAAALEQLAEETCRRLNSHAPYFFSA